MISLHQHPDVAAKFFAYPELARARLLALRGLILAVADELDYIAEMEECLKWGEPSYLVKKGSTIRIDWKARTPDQYAMYFKCTSKLVPTFKEIFGDTFRYEGNRAITFRLHETPNEEALKSCVVMALSYHLIKHRPLLGYGRIDDYARS